MSDNSSYTTELSGENDIVGIEEEEAENTPVNENPKFLTVDDAAKSLCILGKVDTGLHYAYLMMNLPNKNLTDISVIPTFRNVVYVNVSGNRLTSDALEVLVSMTYLLMLQADANRIATAGMGPWLYLQVLCLNRNEISETEGLRHRLLECLELNYNKIRVVSLNPYVLENLKILELRGNQLSTTNGIFLPTLVFLYLADNRISKIEGVETLVSLKVLHLRNNALSTLDGFVAQNAKLSYINLRQNRIRKMSEMKKLGCLANLETLIVSENLRGGGRGNEEEEEEEHSYRVRILIMLPNLKRIDKDPVLEEERAEAADTRIRMLENGLSFSELDAEPEDN